jgi:poly-gamma-glutamate capsule biosynthesis protein CapA/YwtB (metallophosphatase superfamily)
MLSSFSLIAALLLCGCAKTSDAPAPGRPAEAPVEDEGEPTPAAVRTPEGEAVAVVEAEPKKSAEPQKQAELEMTFVGDVIFGRYRASGYDHIPEGEHQVFDKMAEFMKSDALFGNLETPLTRELPERSPIGSTFSFGASLEDAQHLVKAGFVAVSLANNHWADLGRKGAEETPELLEEIGVIPLGAARMPPDLFRVETVEVKGWKIGFVAITTRSNTPMFKDRPITPYLLTSEIKGKVGPVIAEARKGHDLVIVQIHWGDEYADVPAYSQVQAGHAMIDAGADLVIGHHPHVLQGFELYNGGFIAYSLGNFLFENTNDPPRLTGVLRVRFKGSHECLDDIRFHPAYVTRLPVQHPVPARGYMGRKVKQRVRDVSKRFDAKWIDEEHDMVLEMPECG